MQRPRTHTIGKDSVHVESVGRTRLVVCAAAHVGAQLPSPGVVYHPGVGAADLIWRENKQIRRPASRHLRVSPST